MVLVHRMSDRYDKIRQARYQRAKDTIGKVVRLEFKEQKKDITDADRAEHFEQFRYALCFQAIARQQRSDRDAE